MKSSLTFNLGPIIDSCSEKETGKELYYDSKNLTTHGVCLGMTGSGKTGLGIVLLEEAGLDKIPAIIIDPKGDMSNLLLNFPHMSSTEFLPWVDPLEAERQGLSVEKYAETIAKSWREGLNSTGGIERIQKLRDSVDMEVYTPGNSTGTPISLLRSFEAPSKELLADDAVFRDLLTSLTSSILGLLGIQADPIKSREHIYLSLIIEFYWRQSQNLDLITLIQCVQKPPFEKVGALDVDTFFPAKERTALSISLNNLVASPLFKAWMEGDPLDIDQFLASKEGKPKFSIFSIAHLQDSERMFFVTLLLNQVISWMRLQPGTSNLRALIYMDEIFGYFPPSAMPPSKMPMLTLLKQARAYGIGILLATQNPIDLDYKGLANCGTWFIGRLQTERDRMRVTEGLQATSAGNTDMQSFNKILANIGKRVFMLRSIYEPSPILFKTRWTLSYLRGPLTLAQLQVFKKSGNESNLDSPINQKALSSLKEKPIIPTNIIELFAKTNSTSTKQYLPRILGTAKVHFVDSKNKVNQWQEISLITSLDVDGKSALWEEADNLSKTNFTISSQSDPDASFEEVPRGFLNEKNFSSLEKSLSAYLYQNFTFTLFHEPKTNLISKENETEENFKERALGLLQTNWQDAENKIETKYADKEKVITNRIRSAQEKLTAKQQKSFWQKIEAFMSLLSAFLQALVGKKLTKGTISQAGASIKRTGKMTLEAGESGRAEEDLLYYQKQLEEMEIEKKRELLSIPKITEASQIQLEKLEIHPRKSDMMVQRIALLWVPLELSKQLNE